MVKPHLKHVRGQNDGPCKLQDIAFGQSQAAYCLDDGAAQFAVGNSAVPAFIYGILGVAGRERWRWGKRCFGMGWLAGRHFHRQLGHSSGLKVGDFRAGRVVDPQPLGHFECGGKRGHFTFLEC